MIQHHGSRQALFVACGRGRQRFGEANVIPSRMAKCERDGMGRSQHRQETSTVPTSRMVIPFSVNIGVGKHNGWKVQKNTKTTIVFC
ncbi:hypothetical protein GK0397 [Geobacillus kaustophilus HTA426]|uniref:Uncharacterized protein n=1 Tax=Geobacillus kaustophilus (strain HTA426) TaxID=235909 RepID=Q5L2Z8_GEOKA|nr:hypothetical protein GK0397 [Geobacillus kaustophilus HTA426]